MQVVESECAYGRAERAALDRLLQRFAAFAAGLLQALNGDGGCSERRCPNHIRAVVVRRAKILQKRLRDRRRRVAIEGRGDQRALGRRAGDLDEFLRVVTFLTDDRDGNAGGAQLIHQRPGGEVVARRIDQLRIVGFHLGDQRTELAVRHAVLVLVDNLQAEFRRGLLEAGTERLAEIVLEGDHHHLLLAQIARQLGAGAALHFAHGRGTEHIITRQGHIRVDGIGHHVRHFRGLKQRRRRARRRRVRTGYAHHHFVFLDQLGRRRRGFLRRSLVVIDHEFDLRAVDPALGVGVGHRELGAIERRFAVGRRESGQRHVDSDFHLRPRGRPELQRECGRYGYGQLLVLHAIDSSSGCAIGSAACAIRPVQPLPDAENGRLSIQKCVANVAPKFFRRKGLYRQSELRTMSVFNHPRSKARDA